jgi:hypothetical protein
MEDPQVTSASFTTLEQAVGPGWRVRVDISGQDFLDRAVPLVAQVGDVPVESLMVMPGGTALVGFLPEEPADGAKLALGYADTGLQDTDVEYEAGGIV